MAVEDCDAHLLNLNITKDSENDPAHRLIVELRVNHRNPLAVARSIERYGYEVLDYTVSDTITDDEVARNRFDELMHYLNL